MNEEERDEVLRKREERKKRNLEVHALAKQRKAVQAHIAVDSSTADNVPDDSGNPCEIGQWTRESMEV
jgi:hypothetical protein